MTRRDERDERPTPGEGAESEERELAERLSAERGARREARPDEDDPREEEGWTQPESSAQKGAITDEG